MEQELRTSWWKTYETEEEMWQTKRRVADLTRNIRSDVVILSFGKELLVSVWIQHNPEYWRHKLTEILGKEKES